jgi:hypothetical protein
MSITFELNFPLGDWVNSGFYTNNSSKLSTTWIGGYINGVFSYGTISFTNSVIQPPGNPVIALATTLIVNNGENPTAGTYVDYPAFIMTLYPFLNGPNVAIMGGATVKTDTTYNGLYYNVTFLGAQYSTSSSYNLVFNYVPIYPTETLTALNQ